MNPGKPILRADEHLRAARVESAKRKINGAPNLDAELQRAARWGFPASQNRRPPASFMFLGAREN
jgi:hypothetical protein